MLWQRITVSTGAHVGNPAPLPACVATLAEASLANLPAALPASTLDELGLSDTGFLPVADPAPTPPPPSTVMSRIDFMRRFSTAEQAAIATSTDAHIVAFRYMLTIVTGVDLADTDTQNAVNYMQAAGLLDSSGRAATILTP